MATYQRQWNGYVAYKKQSALGTAASGSGGSLLTLTRGHGIVGTTPISSMLVRQDGMAVRGRHGTQTVSAQYGSELMLGNDDAWLASLMRASAWTTAPVITQATGAMSSATLSASGSVITFSAGNVITSGLFVFDVVVFTSALAAADLNRPLRVTALTALTITVAETLTTVAGPVSTYSFSAKGRVLTNPAAGSLVHDYYTVEEVENDIDASTILQDMVVGQYDFTMNPNGMIEITRHLVGAGTAATALSSSSPSLTSPVLPLTTANPLAALDASLRLSNSGDQLALTAFQLTVNNQLVAPAVAASTVSPDVFDGVQLVSGSITVMRSDLSALTDFLAETTISMTVMAKVPGSSPTDFFAITVPYMTFGSAEPSDFVRDGGPRTVTVQFPAALAGIDTRGTGYNATLVKFQRSTTTA